MGKLLESIISAVSEIMHIKNVSIMLLDMQPQITQSGYKKSLLAEGAEKSRGRREKVSSEVVDWLWRNGGPVEIKRVANEKIRRELAKLNVPVCVPLITKQKLIGILNVGEKITGQKFSNEDLELLKRDHS